MRREQEDAGLAGRRARGRARAPGGRRAGRRLVPVVAAAALSAGLVTAGNPAAAADGPEWDPRPSWTSTDNTDGTYRVPLLNADVPDVSVQRLPAAENPE